MGGKHNDRFVGGGARIKVETSTYRRHPKIRNPQYLELLYSLHSDGTCFIQPGKEYSQVRITHSKVEGTRSERTKYRKF